MVCAREVLDERSRNRSSPYVGSEGPAAAPLWADVLAGILGTVLCLLPCLADRASVRSVCRRARAGPARAPARAGPPQVQVLLLDLRRSAHCCPARTDACVEVGGDDVRVVGSSNDWLMAVRPSRDVKRETDGECFLVNAFSSEVVQLPRLQSNSNYSYNCLDVSSTPCRRILHEFVLPGMPASQCLICFT